jgi:hypothetical protein
MAVAVVLLTGGWAAGQAQRDAKKVKNSGNPPADASAANTQTAKSGGNMQNVKSNPMFKDNSNSGDMPQSASRESEDKGASGIQPATPEETRYRPGNNKTTRVQEAGANNSHETVEYKDPEDMTTRYRPGNNKTTKAQPPAANKNHETVEYKDPEDMTTRSKSSKGKTQEPK